MENSMDIPLKTGNKSTIWQQFRYWACTVPSILILYSVFQDSSFHSTLRRYANWDTYSTPWGLKLKANRYYFLIVLLNNTWTCYIKVNLNCMLDMLILQIHWLSRYRIFLPKSTASNSAFASWHCLNPSIHQLNHILPMTLFFILL